MNTPPLRPVTTLPDTRPGSLLKTTRARRASGLDHRAAFGGADFLVAGEQADQRGGGAAEAGEGGQDEAVHHQAGLHVGDAGAIGDAVADGERAARCLAVGKDGVAVAHQHDVAAGVAGDVGRTRPAIRSPGAVPTVARRQSPWRLCGSVSTVMPWPSRNRRTTAPTASMPGLL